MTNLTDWLTQARDRADAATEGPWVASLAGQGARVSEPSGYSLPGCFTCGQNEDGIYEPPDAAFIADARTRLPAALDAIQAVLDLADDMDERGRPGVSDSAHDAASRRQIREDVGRLRATLAAALGVSEP